MSILGGVQKAAVERKKFVVDYTRWLEDEELLVAFTIATTPVTDTPLEVSGGFIDSGARKIIFYLGAGQAGYNYAVRLIAQTSIGQQKLDQLNMGVTA